MWVVIAIICIVVQGGAVERLIERARKLPFPDLATPSQHSIAAVLGPYHNELAAKIFDGSAIRWHVKDNFPWAISDSQAVDVYVRGEDRRIKSNPPPTSETDIVQKLYQPTSSALVKILCVTYTHVEGHAKAVQQHRSWGYQCDRHMIFTNGAIDGGREVIRDYDRNVIVFTPQGGERYTNMWQKTRGIMHRIREAMQEHDFLLMSGDDTFVVVDSLRAYLGDTLGVHRALGLPLFSGYLQRSTFTYNRFISGAGYIMDHLAYDQYINVAYDICHAKDVTFSEDTVMATCMRGLGIDSRNTQDVFGGDVIHPLPPHMMSAMPNRPHSVWWFRDFRLYPMPRGYEAISPWSSLFHFVRDSNTIAALERTARKR